MSGHVRARIAGFTLIEVITVIAILGIVISLAIPSYRNYMLRVHRSEAVNNLLDIATCQERVRADRGRYDTTRCLLPSVEHYVIRMEPPAQTDTLSYTAWADPRGAQSADVCGSLGIDQTGLRLVSAVDADAVRCWRSR